jgi:CarboxypepD_reg-like domain/TonB-dependent Receptor Plug Domain
MLRLFILFFITLSIQAFSQKGTIQGKITDELGKPLDFVVIALPDYKIGTTTNPQGIYRLEIPADIDLTLKISYLGQNKDTLVRVSNGSLTELNFVFKVTEIKGIDIVAKRKDSLQRMEVSMTRLDAKKMEAMPSAFGDFNKILATLAGVVSNNELSATYSVRGGNFDENLVYVNDIQIYRPFLIRAGQQEGLSFINPNLAGDVAFSSGGWQSKYGDKLASVLDVKYREPIKNAGSLTLGILNNQGHIEGISKNQKFTYNAGVRRKSSRYLLNTLPVKGQYLPQFFDFQGYANYEFSKKLSLGFLTSYAQNRYLVSPESQETTFGTINRVLRLFVAFEGQEKMDYDITQNAFKLTYRPNNKLTTNWIISQMFTSEKEYSDVEGGYRLCEINPNFGTQGFNECVTTVGVGSEYLYLRNRLKAQIYAFENRSVYDLSPKHKIEFGLRYSYENINDKLQEYNFTDSAGFVNVIYRNFKDNILESSRFSTYSQHTIQIDTNQTLTYGVRLAYWTVNKEFLVSPTLQYAIKPRGRKDIVWKGAVGVYQQQPFFRELRDFQGNLNLNLKSQKSIHAIIGNDYVFKAFGDRNFRLTNELYYKYLWDVVPYDVDNVRLRYYATNGAKAYAVGWDSRISGEFIKGTESWFSMSLMQTKEDVDFDNKEYIRRPTDQRLTLGMYLEDHLPNNPTWKMNLNLVWGTGLPFNVPNNPELRNVFQGKAFRRVDVGFSKYVDRVRFGGRTVFQSLWIGADILNLLAINNIISYTWVSDLNRQRYAIPNALSARFLNLRAIVKF